jgi:ribose-phosphate pyrophosphokinase
MLADTARSLGARKIIAVVPYLAYSRQDKVFRPYEAVSIKTVLKLLQSCGVKHLIALNVHEPKVFEGLNFTANNLSAFPLLTEYLVNQNLSGAFSASPDKKALQMAVEADKVLGGGHGFFSKERDKVTGEIKMSLGCDFDVKGKNVIVFDDMISSGKTTAMAIKKLKEMGAKRVFSACIHALLVGDAYEKIINAGAEAIFSTDTIPSRVSVVSVAPVIAEFLKGKQPE